MTTPKFILDLREKIGHDLLWLTGISGIVLDDAERILLVRRADTGLWSLPAGILEPGEHPAVAMLREIHEETGVEAEIERLVSIDVLPPGSYPNGDQVQFLDLTFRCSPLRGEARVNDDESLEVAWFDLTGLPPLPDRQLASIANARSADPLPLYTGRPLAN
ncbi:NUDIX domain-containing protein [Streptomyces sp. SID13031]|uniref:NUDIX hydrolase n=1 Tax=Streptomyces sp. SID13031 TaxID=2706046 RepID=UPI0013C651D6|nr:NUDIX domain-containing protein [Streptomyces sp. SID13031]NEA33005.1 NUDIX domain-containing protein [Streptomyces sp. SID13031]